MLCSFNFLVENVIKQGLCCGCGTCVGMCKNNTIDFINNNYYPEYLDIDACNNCDLCIKTCPGGGLELNHITKEIKMPEQEYNVNLGNYISFKIGHSKDDFIQQKSASGGIATSLLIHALDKKIIDKVIIVTNDEKLLAKPKFKITDSKKEILESMQSKYIQLPLNKALKDILKSDLCYAIVGLPCHMEGLYLAQQVNKQLSKKIKLKIGLFCGYSYSYDCVNTLIKRMELKNEDIDKFLGWREGNQYPGSFSLRLKNGKISNLSYIKEHNITVANYSLLRCHTCIDSLCQLSDISLGDTGFKTKNRTLIISRTETGEQQLKMAKKDGYIEYYDINSNTAINQTTISFMIREKRHKVLSVINHLSKRNKSIPNWDIKKSKTSKINTINSILRIEAIYLIRKPFMKKILTKNPKLMEAIGGIIYRFDINPKKAVIRKITKLLRNHPKLRETSKKIYQIVLLKNRD